MDQLTQIDTRLNALIATSAVVSAKLDAIIERNAKADTNLALLAHDMRRHQLEDERQFMANDKKHKTYDNFVLGTLIFAVLQLLGVVGYFINK